MAASENKPDEEAFHRPDKFVKKENLSSEFQLKNYPRVYKPWALESLFYALTIAIFAATLVTDFLVFIEHWLNSYKSWAYFTVGLVLVPSYFIQIVSLKWYQNNGNLKLHQWISHLFLLAIMHRFSFLLNSAMRATKTQFNPQQRDLIFKVENDTFTLNLFTSLLVSIPQIILQIYIMAILQHISFWTIASVIASLCSLTWALIAYALQLNRTNQSKTQSTWSSMMIQSFWKGGMLASRIAALILVAICFKTWIVVLFVVHTLCMTLWIMHQTTNFCLTTIEDFTYKSFIGIIYFFDFFKLNENQIKYHVCVFYSIMVLQSTFFYLVYLLFYKDHFPKNISIISTVMIIGGNFVGVLSMFIYFCMFQNLKSIKQCKYFPKDTETSLKNSPKNNFSKFPKQKRNNEIIENSSISSLPSDITADKKSLLTNIVQQNAESLEKGIFNKSFIQDDDTNVTIQVVVEDNKNININVSHEKLQNHLAIEKKFENNIDSFPVQIPDNQNTDSLHRQKRRGICLEAELNLNLKEGNVDLESQLCSDMQKRRGICSLTQLGLEIITDEDNYVGKSLSLDKLKSNSENSLSIEDKSLDSGILESLPVKSLITGNTCNPLIPENILSRGRLNTPVISENEETNQLSDKESSSGKQEEAMSQITSVHDYENLLPLGVARPPWCIRSWKGYTDIETYIHDDSIVRDRRRDTLTSTATGTTFSSEFSDATYASIRKFIKRSRQDDYIDTLIYDLVDWESISNKTGPNEEISAITDSMEEPQDETNLFSAKPIVIDERGGMLALDTILEEREDQSSFPDLRMNFRNPKACSVSSLVATIDEIRKCSAENSPRHVYHRTESQWEDVEQKIFLQQSHITKVLFSNDYSNANFTYANPWTNSLIKNVDKDKLNIMREMTNYCLKDSTDKIPLINAILSDSPILASKTEDQSCNNIDVEEDNVYVDMSRLGTQICKSDNQNEVEIPRLNKAVLIQGSSILSQNNDQSLIKKIDGNSRKKVNFQLMDEIINESLESYPESSDTMPIQESNNLNTLNTPFHTKNELPAKDHPGRKISLLRERFEPKVNEKVVNVSTLQNEKKVSYSTKINSLSKQISIIKNDSEKSELSLNSDKENLTKKSRTVLDTKVVQSDVKEKRNVFLKQVLTPPKFQGWSKKRTFSPNAKITSKAH